MVVEAEIFPAVLTCLKDPDEYVKKNVATLIREIAKHTPEVNEAYSCIIAYMYTLRIFIYGIDSVLHTTDLR